MPIDTGSVTVDNSSDNKQSLHKDNNVAEAMTVYCYLWYTVIYFTKTKSSIILGHVLTHREEGLYNESRHS